MHRVDDTDITYCAETPSAAFVRRGDSAGPSHQPSLQSPMFSKCPHCGASILDDTEELCPSCDQPLKGAAKAKPKAAAAGASKPAEKTAAAKPADAKKPEAKKPAAPAAKPSGEDDDDPFDIGGQTGKQAVRVHPKPAKGRMYRVECPMCESPGFVPMSAAGEEVRCWNKDCRLPLYKAPAIEKEPEPEPEPKKKPIAAILLVLILLGGGGFAGYYVMNNGEGEKVIKKIDPTNVGSNTDEPDDGPGGLIKVDPNANKGPKVVTNADVVAQALAAMPRQVTDPKNQSQDDANRLAAEAFILAGKPAEADKMLANIRPSAAFYKIRPLVLRANKLLESGDKAGAGAVADEALKLSGKLPPAGREALDWATDLAILLVRLDRIEEAASLIEKNHDAGIRGEYSALLAGARNSGTYDLADLAGATLIQNTPNPQWVAVTRGLVSLGDRDAALVWAKRGSGSVAGDSLVAWAGTQGSEESINAEAIVAQADSPALAARLLAAAGLEAYTRALTTATAETVEVEAEATEGTDGAEAKPTEPAPPTLAMTLLQAAVAKLPAAEAKPMAVPSLREFYDSSNRPRGGLENKATVRTEALAFLKVAELQYAVGQPDVGWKTLQTGIEHLRSYAPDPVAMADVVEAYDSRRNAVRSQLESELGLDTRNKVNSAFNRYRKQVDLFKEASDERFALQERLAKAAIANGSEKQLLTLMEASQGEPWWTSGTAAELTRSTEASIASRAKSLVQGTPAASPEPWRRIVVDAVEAGDMIGLARKLNGLRRDIHTQGLWAGVAASLLVREQNEAGLVEFVKYLTDNGVRADVVEMAMAQTVKRGPGASQYDALVDHAASLTPHEKVAVFRGAAVAAGQKPPADPEPATTE